MKIGELLIKGYNVLKCENIETYMLDTQLLLQKVLKKDKLFIMLNRELEVDEGDIKEYFRLIELRKNKMPIKYILEECEFMGINFNVREGVLIPRGDTEILVEEALDKIKQNNYIDICDVCCGSGAIGISIGEILENTRIYCYDISDTAYEVTLENINKFNLEDRIKIYKSDLLEEAIESERRFDVVLSNPPYIRKDVIPTLMEDVKNYEPYIALCGGDDGLEFYKKITKQSLKILKQGGMIGFEIGHDQKEDVYNILMGNGFEEIRCIKDLAGLDRVVTGILRVKN
ncbi:peptide chain release factor N(5)-glutamine methyltransferase [Clostridium sp. ZS2-4]|uniref:peptide chain release factor N(5)-glutamine methyltransferase n=1 Tax=Clostridium sp. ZS2-4 TaxID=2987703 RepID=UPI00227D1B7D|nr:peptide chain release factor N(5)-glutamine methyltransferase [Clostridium sp. ZS2-4]MCY6355498.1 peptide chain release factor N(5)-glutamine methyltransferase [Clostridium sp. ZS2-4]